MLYLLRLRCMHCFINRTDEGITGICHIVGLKTSPILSFIQRPYHVPLHSTGIGCLTFQNELCRYLEMAAWPCIQMLLLQVSHQITRLLGGSLTLPMWNTGRHGTELLKMLYLWIVLQVIRYRPIVGTYLLLYMVTWFTGCDLAS